ncbi:molecular chaperone [Halopenitus sp. H-Gu1]|uniref:TorD/DmsD family molecular chaperone n=1 Tax=Halopenitus sp. H-Gu1 TaxID=3242697 RepID=UPI00359DB825
MSKDTILGDSPSGTRPGPDSVVPGEGPVEDHELDDDGSTDTNSEQLTPDVPGDEATAFHRSRVYSLLALGFERPGGAFQEAVDADAYSTDLVESAGVIDDDLQERAQAIGAHVDDADVLHDEWASLFGVEEGVSVSPYELTYMPGPLMTNVRKLADLSGFYEAFDLEVAPGQNDRRDHICFLLEFLGLLSLQESTLRHVDDSEGLAVVGNARFQFVEEHLGRWYWRFVDEVSQHNGDGFYAALADLLAVLLKEEIDRLDVDPEWVPNNPEVSEWNEDVFGDSGRGCGGCGVNPQGVAGQDSALPDLDATETDQDGTFER